MNIMKQLDFGQDSAESEIHTLNDVFLTLPFYERLRDTKQWLVIGRKGTGKSAACIMFSHQMDEGEKVISISAKRLSMAKSTNLDKAGLNPEDVAQKQWEYVFLLQVSKYIIERAKEKHGDNYVQWPESFQKIRSFLAEHDNDHADWFDKVKKFFNRISKFGVKIFEAEGSIEVDKTLASGTELSQNLERVFSLVVEVSETIFDRKCYILVDQVDDLWDSTKEQQVSIVGLLRASKTINDQMKLIKVIVFLRSDIFDYLDFNNKDHFRSAAEAIQWNETNLQRLITLRIGKSTKFSGDEDYLWELVFPKRINNERTIRFLLKHTLMRPRDFIQLCNICRNNAYDNGHTKISTEDIKKAITQYSRWKVEDLISEYSFQYPFLEQLLLTIFHGYDEFSISREEFESLFSSFKDEFIKKYGEIYFVPLDNLLQSLYTIGFLGVIYRGEWMHESLGDKFVVPHATLFAIHPAFRSGLNITNSSALQIGGKVEIGGHNTITTINQTGNISISGSIIGEEKPGKKKNRQP